MMSDFSKRLKISDKMADIILNVNDYTWIWFERIITMR